MQQICIKKGNILFNGEEAIIRKYTEITQCLACLEFGHIRNCYIYSPRCRYCAQHHNTNECKNNIMRNSSVCVNCMELNKEGNVFDINHRATDEKCNTKRLIIEELETKIDETKKGCSRMNYNEYRHSVHSKWTSHSGK